MLHEDRRGRLGLASSLSVFLPDLFQMCLSILPLVCFACLSLAFVVGLWLDALLHYIWNMLLCGENGFSFPSRKNTPTTDYI